MAISLVPLMALLALGIDVGMLFDARREAQRAADSAALAGASAFLDFPALEAPKPARERAISYALQNWIRNQQITEPEISVWVNVDSATVTVNIRREGVSTWFARLLGETEVPIGAQATAQASDAGVAQCLKPFAVPDMWDESNDDTNGNRVWDDGERWHFDPGQDRYERYEGEDGSGTATGYGSDWRDPFADAAGGRYTRDYGREIKIKVTDPQTSFVPSFFYPWVLPVDDSQPDCGAERPGNGVIGGLDGSGPSNGDGGSGGTTTGSGNIGGAYGRGAAAYRRNICSCNASPINLDTEYDLEPGNMVGPTADGVASLIAQDPDAYWDDSENRVISPFGDNSPRIITVALFDPTQLTKGGRQTIQFNNFARFFIEKQESRKDPVVGRFMFYVSATGATSEEGETTGSLVKRLRLIR